MAPARRHIVDRASTIGVLMRNSVALVASGIALADGASLASSAGTHLMVAVFGWSLFRIATRSRRPVFDVLDCVAVLAVCLGIPLITADPAFYAHNTVPQVIAGTAVISFSVELPAAASFAMAATVAGAYAWGSAAVIGAQSLGSMAVLYYLCLQWLAGALIRHLLLRAALTVDRVRAQRLAAELAKRVGDSVRDFGREQIAVLHDTAASTLFMLGQGSGMPDTQLAARARRDLEVLEGRSLTHPAESLELVAALKKSAQSSTIHVRFCGLPVLWVDGETGTAVESAAREAMNNAERHAFADELCVTVAESSVTLSDDGIGFANHEIRRGHGLDGSILGRMRRVGGSAHIGSTPGAGTTVELHWPTTSTAGDDIPADPDGLIERIRVRYGLALLGYALANLAFAVTHAIASPVDSGYQISLAVAAGFATLAAVPEIVQRRWRPVWWAAAVLFAVTIVQTVSLPAELLGGYAHWTQSVIGWCALPMLLGLSARTGAAVLIGFWFAGALSEVAVAMSWSTLVNIGLGTASILAVQLCALAFNALVRSAAADAYDEASAHRRLVIADRLERALRTEYQRRFAALMDSVLPVLRRLSGGEPVTRQLQDRARTESRKLRMLFDQALTFEHPLMAGLRPIIDGAEASGVGVTVGVSGKLPDIPAHHVDELLAPVKEVLSLAVGTARLVIHGCAEEVSVSVVVSQISGGILRGTDSAGGVTIEIVESDAAAWLLIRLALTLGTDATHA